MFTLFKGKVEMDYKDKAKTIIMNLQRNKELSDRLKKGELLPKDLVVMDPKDMANKEIKEHREKVENEAFEARRTDWMNSKMKDTVQGLFQCGKCKKYKTTYYQQQTRGADEPMTTYALFWSPPCQCRSKNS